MEMSTGFSNAFKYIRRAHIEIPRTCALCQGQLTNPYIPINDSSRHEITLRLPKDMQQIQLCEYNTLGILVSYMTEPYTRTKAILVFWGSTFQLPHAVRGFSVPVPSIPHLRRSE